MPAGSTGGGDTKDREIAKQESSDGERCGRLWAMSMSWKKAGNGQGITLHRELPPVTAAAAGGEPSERDGKQLPAGRT